MAECAFNSKHLVHFLMVEKGAHFRGDSYITARYTSSNLDKIKIQLAFSTTAVRNLAQALLLIQTSNALVLFSASDFQFLIFRNFMPLDVIYRTLFFLVASIWNNSLKFFDNYLEIVWDTNRPFKHFLGFETFPVKKKFFKYLITISYLRWTNRKTKYLLISLTALGNLRLEDDRGMGVVYGAEVKTINFLNGARHSIYYRRNGASALLLVRLSYWLNMGWIITFLFQ